MTTVVDAEVQLTVVSDAAGRMRVQATGFQFDAGRAVAIEDTVGKVAGVQAVHAYPRTASIVIWYSQSATPLPSCRQSSMPRPSLRRRCPRMLRARPVTARPG